MKRLIFGVFLMMIVIGLTGCTKAQESPFGEGYFGLPFDEELKPGNEGDEDTEESEDFPGGVACDVFPTVQINEDSQGNNYTYPGYRSLDDNLDGVLTGSEFCSGTCSFSESVVEYVTPYGEIATSTLLACDEGIEYEYLINNWDEVIEEGGAIHWIKMDTMCCEEKDVLDMFEEDCLLTFSGLYNSTPVDVKEVCDFYNSENGEQTKCVFGQWMAQDGHILTCNYELSPDEEVHTMCCSI